jgi:exopolysaccharide biosynthesis polyprenyl glycosylphosphotransferase
MFFRRTVLFALYKFSDILILFCSLAVAIVISGYEGMPSTLNELLSAQITIQNFIVIIIAISTWHVIFQLFGLYETKRMGSRVQECIDIIKATSLGTFFITSFISIFYAQVFNGVFVFLLWVLSSLSTITARMTMRLLLIMIRNRGRNLRHMILIGSNQRVQRFAQKIRKRKDLGYNLIGFVDDESFDNSKNTELLSDLQHFSDVLKRHVVDEVVIGLPIKTFYKEINRVLRICEEQGIIVRFLTDLFFDLRLAKSRVDDFEGSSLLTLYTAPLDGWFFEFKRLFDIVFSFFTLILLLPLFIVVGILIRLDSAGSVFFLQERVGYNKRRFNVYKFRTMIKDAEKKQSELEHLNEMSGPVFKIKDDPRVTRVGRFLRKTSIDELPQLLNVLKGDMSLVGPRPLPVRDFECFEKDWQKRRFSIRPGLTCLWQINGRNEVPFEKWIELDMEYIDNFSFMLDLKILFKTIPAVFRGMGAM